MIIEWGPKIVYNFEKKWSRYLEFDIEADVNSLVSYVESLVLLDEKKWIIGKMKIIGMTSSWNSLCMD